MQLIFAPPPAQSYDYSAMFNSAPSNVNTLQGSENWILDSGATTHITNSTGNLTSFHSPTLVNSRSIVVGNGSCMPIYSVGSTSLTDHPFFLNQVLVSPSVIKNIISVRKFTRDNSCSIEFDPHGFSVKDLATRNILLRSSSSGELYPFFGDLESPEAALSVSTTRELWHRRLGHLSAESLSHIPHAFPPHCNKSSNKSPLCEACQLG
jgi:hypothetical protein